MRLQERSKYLAAHPDEDPDNPFNSNGFPKSFAEIGDVIERVRETVRWWLIMHYGNTGGTDSNINKLVKEVMRIYKFQEEQTNVKEVLDQ
jgi:hypothetical protein